MLLLLLFSSIVLHPLHVSLSNIDYDKDKQTIDIAIKMFDDDIRPAIYKKYNISLPTNNEVEFVNIDSLFNEYISDNFIVWFDNSKRQKLNYVKKEKKTDAIWFYFTVEVNDKMESITIKNTLLNDLYDDQKNLIMYKSGSNEKANIFDKNKTIYKIDL